MKIRRHTSSVSEPAAAPGSLASLICIHETRLDPGEGRQKRSEERGSETETKEEKEQEEGGGEEIRSGNYRQHIRANASKGGKTYIVKVCDVYVRVFL